MGLGTCDRFYNGGRTSFIITPAKSNSDSSVAIFDWVLTVIRITRIFPASKSRQTGGHLLAVPKILRRNTLGDRSQHQPIQLLLGHSDTVWPLGTLETMPLSLRQGKMYGPGVYDMKAGLVQIVFALEAIASLTRISDPPQCLFKV
ncbi:MAG: M20/M25/M40 family metallo-hydrolase [Waterburya sp.]